MLARSASAKSSLYPHTAFPSAAMPAKIAWVNGG